MFAPTNILTKTNKRARLPHRSADREDAGKKKEK